MAGRTDPREVALRLLDQVTGEGRLLTEVQAPLTAGLAPAEAARAGRLAISTLRQIGRIDRLLGPHLRKRPPERVLNLLRLGALELAEGGAPHGVVHAMVGLAKADKTSLPMAGLVNAVLRKLTLTVPPGWQGMPPPELPKMLRKRLIAAWGKAIVADIEAVIALAPPLDLIPKDGDAAALAALVGGEVLPTGSVRLAAGAQVSALPGFAEGAFWVQDAAAALPARLLAVRPGERVLDLCAAPGGKTLQLAAAGATVTALDISEPRMARVRENLARCGLTADLVVADARDWRGGPFDAVLVDAPCSGTGTLRRHPDLPQARRELDLAPLLALQSALIDRAAAQLRPGGRLVYCTCSLLPEEGEAQAEAALARGLIADPGAVAALGLDPAWLSGMAGLRTRPDHWAASGGIDGFHMAAFQTPA